MNPSSTTQRVIPAIIPTGEAHLETSLQQVSFAHEVHIDVVDGQFVDPVSWPYDPPGEPGMQASKWYRRTVEVDLMVAAPVPAAEQWVAAGAEMLVFHVETLSLAELQRFAAAHDGVSIGVSALNDTAWETLAPYLAMADYVQVMGIATIGAQGATFDERALARIASLQDEQPERLISVDGSVNLDTILRLQQAGADRFIVGSAIMRADDPEAAYDALEASIRPQ